LLLRLVKFEIRCWLFHHVLCLRGLSLCVLFTVFEPFFLNSLTSHDFVLLLFYHALNLIKIQLRVYLLLLMILDWFNVILVRFILLLLFFLLSLALFHLPWPSRPKSRTCHDISRLMVRACILKYLTISLSISWLDKLFRWYDGYFTCLTRLAWGFRTERSSTRGLKFGWGFWVIVGIWTSSTWVLRTFLLICSFVQRSILQIKLGFISSRMLCCCRHL